MMHLDKEEIQGGNLGEQHNGRKVKQPTREEKEMQTQKETGGVE